MKTAQKKRQGNVQRTSYAWHSWLGVLTGLLLFIICWSGTFATVSNELDWLVNPALRVTPQDRQQPIEALYQAVQTAHPEAEILGGQMPLYPRFAADFLIKTPRNQTLHVYVNPYTAEITGHSSFLNLQRYFRDVHRRLHFGNFGFYLICLTSIPLLISLVTSLIFYKRWWTRFFDFKTGKSLRSVVSLLHRLLGLWSLWFVLLIAVTGGWYLFEKARSQFVDGVFVYVDAFPGAVKPLQPLAQPEDDIPFAELLQAVRSARPELDIKAVALDRKGYFYVTGQAGHLLVRNRANKVFLNPDSGAIIYNQTARDLPLYWRWSNMADPLHFGDFGGLISKLVWVLFGLCLCFLSLSGMWLFARRLANNKRLRHKGLISGAITLAITALVVFCLPIPLVFAAKYGPTMAGAVAAVGIAPGVYGFLLAWITATVLLCLSWLAVMITPLKSGGRKRQQPTSRAR